MNRDDKSNHNLNYCSVLGPIGFPVVGYLPFLDVPNLGRSFQRISKRYGDIFSIMVGTKPMVVLNSYPLIKEAMSKKELSGRPSIFSGTFFQKGKIRDGKGKKNIKVDKTTK